MNFREVTLRKVKVRYKVRMGSVTNRYDLVFTVNEKIKEKVIVSKEAEFLDKLDTLIYTELKEEGVRTYD